jgi:GAF domain-containing protein
VADQGFDQERLARVRVKLGAAERDPSLSLCSASASLMHVAGAGIVLVSAERTLGNVCVSDPMTEAVEEIQYTLGEGPCVDAFHAKLPVLVPDLASPELTRWSGFRDGALSAGVCAVFGFPMLVGSACIGALNLYHDRTGELTSEQFADAVVVAHVAAQTVMGWQAAAEVGSLAWQLEQVPNQLATIHQAGGMISLQLGVSVEDGLALLRAHAFSGGRPLSSVAADVVTGRLRFGS